MPTPPWPRESYENGPAVPYSALSSTDNGYGAAMVGIEDSAGALEAATAEAALAELAALRIQKRTVTVTHVSLTEAVDNTAQAINIGDVLPANAVVLGHEVNVATLFSGGGVSAVTLDIGGTDIDAIVDGQDVFTGAATGALSNTNLGVHPIGKFSSEQLVATFLTDSGHDLEDLTAGSLTITVWFFVLA